MKHTPLVLMQTPSGEEVPLVPGDIIGRAPSAALTLNNPHVSEVHAHISLRGEALCLILLRQVVLIDGQKTRTIVLRDEQSIQLVPGCTLRVLQVVNPDVVLGVQVDGGQPVALPGDRGSITLPPPALHARITPGAAARFWRTGGDWHLQRDGHPEQPLVPGTAWEDGGHRFSVVELPIAEASLPATQVAGLTVHHTSEERCRVTRRAPDGDEHTVALTGNAAWLLHELVQFREPVHYSLVGGILWHRQAREAKRQGLDDNAVNRILWNNFKPNIRRLRRKLHEAGIDGDELLPTLGDGYYGLRLRPGDIVEDWT